MADCDECRKPGSPQKNLDGSILRFPLIRMQSRLKHLIDISVLSNSGGDCRSNAEQW